MGDARQPFVGAVSFGRSPRRMLFLCRCLMLLARLALHAGEVAGLELGDAIVREGARRMLAMATGG